MEFKRIETLPPATTLDGAEVIHVVQGGNSRNTTTAAIANLAGGLADAPSDGNLYARRNAAWEAFTPGAGGGGSSSATVNSQSGTSYTLALGDAENFVEMTNGSANTVTIPTNASVAYPVGTTIVVIRTGAGTTTVQGDTGVSINGVSAGSTDIGSAYQAVSLVKTGTDSWVANGGDIVGNNISLPTADTASFDIVDADLVGNVILRADSASAIVVTVPPGLTGTEPVTVVRKGTGAVSFAAGSGVTINSADGHLNLRAQYSSATLIKEAADTFLLIGDLSA